MVAAASSLALILIMFVFDWFGYDDVPGGGSAWQWMSFLDIVLFLCALVAIAIALLRANGQMPELPAPPGMLVAGAGALAVVIVLFRLVIPGDGPLEEFTALIDAAPDATRKIGAFLGLISAGGIAFGGYTAMNERASGAAPPASAAAPPPPAASEPPTSPPPTV